MEDQVGNRKGVVRNLLGQLREGSVVLSDYAQMVQDIKDRRRAAVDDGPDALEMGKHSNGVMSELIGHGKVMGARLREIEDQIVALCSGESPEAK